MTHPVCISAERIPANEGKLQRPPPLRDPLTPLCNEAREFAPAHARTCVHD